MTKILVDKDIIEDLVDWLSGARWTGGNFPMETHRAEAEGIDHLLHALMDALQDADKEATC